MEDFIKIKEYFSTPELTMADINNGFALKTFNNLAISYLVKGESYSKKDFLIETAYLGYVLDYTGNIKFIIDPNILNIDNSIKQWNAWNIFQLDPIHYSFIAVREEAKKLTDSWLIIIEYDYINKSYKLIKKYRLIDNNLAGNILPDQHAYIIKDLNHIYLQTTTHNKGITNYVIQEQQNDKIVWQWESKDCPELAELGIRHKQGNEIHLNYMVELDINTLLVSFRNAGIAAIDKSSGNICWFIGKERNDFKFIDLPYLQHYIEFWNSDKSQLGVFNNNWHCSTLFIREIFDTMQISLSDFNNIKYSSLNIYDLNTKKSRSYSLNNIYSPRMGSVIRVADYIADVNYGDCLMPQNNYLYRLGLLEERNLITGEINFCLKTPSPSFAIRRGL